MDSNTIIIVANVIGGIGLAFTCASMILKEKKWVILLQAINSIFQIVSYAMLKAWSGCFLNVVVLIMDIFIFFDKQTKPLSVFFIILSFALGLVGVVTTCLNLTSDQILWQELIISLLPVLGSTGYNTAALKKDIPLVLMKIAFMISCGLWAVYSFHIQSYVGIVFNLIAVFTSILGIIGYEIRKRRQVSPVAQDNAPIEESAKEE